MDYTLAIPDALDAELQREVAQYNRTKEADMPDIDALGMLMLWVTPKLHALQRQSRDRTWHDRRTAYEAAPADKQREADTAIGLTTDDRTR